MTINLASIYVMLVLDSLPLIRRLHNDGVINLFRKGDRFMDWINAIHAAGLSDVYALDLNRANPTYGPLTYLLLRPLAHLSLAAGGRMGLEAEQALRLIGSVSWLLVAAGCLLFTALIASVAQRCQYRVPLRECLFRYPIQGLNLQLILISFPIVFAFDRGNIELVMLPLVSCYVYGVCHGIRAPSWRLTGQIPGLLLLAMAASMKPYLLAFALFNPYSASSRLSRSNGLKSLAWVGLTALISLSLVLLSLALLQHGNPGMGGYTAALSNYHQIYSMQGAGDQWYLSPYTALRILLTDRTSLLSLNGFTQLYQVLAAVLGILLLTCALRLQAAWKLRAIVTLTCVCLMIILFPGLANEYKAIYFIIPLLMGLQLGRGFEGIAGRTRQLLISSLALCMFISLNRYGLLGDVRKTSALSALAVGGFSLLLLLLGWPCLELGKLAMARLPKSAERS
ncbi:MAG: hypothetical protein VKK62_08505 [Synechococcaceae cyanobacterium]|nr:hypothetical protein [Synechococcaceae cyanobacterium]